MTRSALFFLNLGAFGHAHGEFKAKHPPDVLSVHGECSINENSEGVICKTSISLINKPKHLGSLCSGETSGDNHSPLDFTTLSYGHLISAWVPKAQIKSGICRWVNGKPPCYTVVGRARLSGHRWDATSKPSKYCRYEQRGGKEMKWVQMELPPEFQQTWKGNVWQGLWKHSEISCLHGYISFSLETWNNI